MSIRAIVKEQKTIIPDRTLNYFAYPGIEMPFSPEYIIGRVCWFFKVSKEDLIGKTRLRKIVIARHFCMYFIKTYSKLSLKKIGNIFNRDHSTVIYALDTVKDLCVTDKKFKEQFNELKKYIQ